MDESRGAVTERPTQEGHTNKPDEALLGVGSGSSEPPSNAITLVPETVDGGGNTIEEASISRSNGPQRKTRIGVLPKIKKFQRLVGVAKIEYGNHEDAGDEFTFPDESPRMIRPKKKPKRPPPLKTAAVTKSNAQTKPIPTASKTRANPKAEPIQEQVNDTVDDENSLSLKVAQDRSPRKLVPKTKTVARRAGKSPVSTHSRKSTGYGLRSTQKLNTPSCNTGLADPFAIPSDDAPMTRIPNKRKRTEDLDYNESEAVIPEAKRSRGANKQVQASQTMTKRNTKRRGGKSGVSNASTVKAKTRKHEQQMSLEKHTVLASLLSKPEQDQLPKSKLDSRTSVNDEHITKGSDRLTDGDGMLPQSHRTSSSVIDRTEMPSEADIISRLNCRTEEQDFQNATAHKITDGMKLHNDLDDDALNIWNEARSENNIARDPAVEPEEVLASLHEKHAAELNSPSTPRVNKLMKNVSGIGNDTSRANTLNPPTTFAPPRIMRDPSSPCADATRVRLEQTGSLNDQDISGLRTIEETPKTQSNAQKLKRKWTPSQELIIMAEVDGHPTWAHTPIHHPIVRTQSGGSVNIEVLSSNSKPLPAPPEAPSRAISGHAYSTDVELEMTVGEYEMAKSDPFAHPAKRHKGTDFIRRLTGESDHSSTREVHHQPSRVEIAVVSKMQSSTGRTPKVIQRSQQTSEANLSQGDEEDSIKTSERVNNDPATLHAAPMKQPRNRVSNASVKEQYISSGDPSPQNIEHTLLRERHNLRDEHVRMEGDTTLVAEEEQPSGPLKASPVHFRSSPPARRFSHSSHSSTSAEPEQLQESDIGPCILTEEAEDMEWQQSLQPHQRGIGEQLTRVSRRILQNIIDNEDAVKDIADTYATDGQTLLNSIYNRCDSRVQSIFTGIDTKKTTMKSVLSGVAKRLKEETDQVEDEPVQYALAKELANDSRNTRSE
jgi:hypothetical protein